MGDRLKHLDVDQRAELFLEVEQMLGAALMPFLEHQERGHVCPHCVARVVSIALAGLATWYGAFAANGMIDREQVIGEFLRYVESTLQRYLVDLAQTEAPPTATPTRGVH
jgi:hypothetical protein